MLDRIQNFATGRNVLIFFAIELVFMLGVMPYMGMKMAALAENGKPLDLEIPTYTPAHAHSMIEGYGEEGRALYKTIEMTADILYPISMAIAYSLIIAYLFNLAVPHLSWTRWLPLIPIATLLFDLIENYFIVNLLNQYPEQPNDIARLAGSFSLGKWSSFFLTLGIIVTGLILVLINWLRKRSVTE